MEKMGARIPQGRFGARLSANKWSGAGIATAHCQAEGLVVWGAGRNEEVGAVAAFLASPAAAHIIGDVIHVNGGMLFGS